MERRSASGLIIVGDVQRRDPRFECLCCGRNFDHYTPYEMHVVRCSAAHEAEDMSKSLRVQNPALYDPNLSDVRQWMNKRDASGETNAKKVLEFRKRL